MAGDFLQAGAAKYDARTQALTATVYGLAGQVGVLLPYSRKHESEADFMGLKFMARAGYQPQEAVKFWERFAAFNRQAGGGQLAWLRTHPLDETRIQQVKAWLPEAQQEFRPQN